MKEARQRQPQSNTKTGARVLLPSMSALLPSRHCRQDTEEQEEESVLGDDGGVCVLSFLLFIFGLIPPRFLRFLPISLFPQLIPLLYQLGSILYDTIYRFKPMKSHLQEAGRRFKRKQKRRVASSWFIFKKSHLKKKNKTKKSKIMNAFHSPIGLQPRSNVLAY